VNLIDRLYTIPEVIVFLTVETASVPTVPEDKRLAHFKKHTDSLYQIIARYGYGDSPNEVSEIIELAEAEGLPNIYHKNITYFMNNEHIIISKKSFKEIHQWVLLNLFSILKRMFPNRPRNFELPGEDVVEIGIVAFL